jgi:threonine/homoserine/homoserine lactone efflux protein
MLSSILSFTAVAAMLTITPGVDTMLVLSQALRDGRRNAVACGLGINTGLIGWAAASVLGLSALLAASQVAYDAVRLLGAGYLVYLGGRALLATRRRNGRTERSTPARATNGPAESSAPAPARGRSTALAAYRRGVTTNLLNPKVGVFYVSLLPQFAPAGHHSAAMMLLLAGIHLALSLLWLGGLAWLASRARHVLSATVKTRLERISGVVMIGLGLRIATRPN